MQEEDPISKNNLKLEDLYHLYPNIHVLRDRVGVLIVRQDLDDGTIRLMNIFARKENSNELPVVGISIFDQNDDVHSMSLIGYLQVLPKDANKSFVESELSSPTLEIDGIISAIKAGLLMYETMLLLPLDKRRLYIGLAHDAMGNVDRDIKDILITLHPQAFTDVKLREIFYSSPVVLDPQYPNQEQQAEYILEVMKTELEFR